MERIETGALTSFICPPSLWCRFVDDTYVIIKKLIEAAAFEQHLNKQNTNVKFTKEVEQNRQLSYCDTLNKRQEDGTISILRFTANQHTLINTSTLHLITTSARS